MAPTQPEGLNRRQVLGSAAGLVAAGILPGIQAAQAAASGKILRCKVLVSEGSLSRLFQHADGRNVGILTATKSTHTADTNLALNKELRWEIRTYGFGVLHIKGEYIEDIGASSERVLDTEHSYILVGKDRDDSGNIVSK